MGASILEPVYEWLDTWGEPVVNALYSRDQAAAHAALARARELLAAEPALSEDQRTAAGLKLHYYEYQIHKALGDRSEWRHHFEEALGRIGWPVYTPAALIMQRILLCLLRASGMRLHYCKFPAKTFHELFDGIPDEDRGAELWHSAANWAFYNRREDVLGEALAYFTVEADGWLSDYTWQHVNTMYQLVAGKAVKQDVEELLRRIKLTPQLEDLNRHIWPRIVELGLADNDVEALRQQATERVQREGDHVPRRELRTKATLKRL
jgi:hypothetical protein